MFYSLSHFNKYIVNGILLILVCITSIIQLYLLLFLYKTCTIYKLEGMGLLLQLHKADTFCDSRLYNIMLSISLPSNIQINNVCTFLQKFCCLMQSSCYYLTFNAFIICRTSNDFYDSSLQIFTPIILSSWSSFIAIFPLLLILTKSSRIDLRRLNL